MKAFKGKVKFNGAEYDVKVVDGIRLVKLHEKWLTTDEFLELLPQHLLDNLAFVGKVALQDEIMGRKPEKGKYQYLVDEYPKLFR